MNFLSLLNAKNFCTFNRELAHKIGLHEAIFLHAVIARYEQNKDRLVSLEGDEYFYYTVDDAKEDTTLGDKPQTNAIKKLISLGIFKKKTIGLPSKRHFSINLKNLGDLFDDKEMFTNSSQRADLGTPKGRIYDLPKGGPHLYTNKNKEKNKGSKVSEKPSTPPPEAVETALYFLKRLQKLFPKMKDPNLNNWISTIRLMHQRDGREWKEIMQVIDFAMDHSFWCKNILSAETLRKQFDKLYAQMTPVTNKGTIEVENKQNAMRLLDYLKSEKNGNRIVLYKDYIFIPEKNEKIMYSVNPSIFEELLSKYLGVKKK